MGNTKRDERHRIPVYFTPQEYAQLQAILAGRNFNRWAREMVAKEATSKGLPFTDELPETGKYERKKTE